MRQQFYHRLYQAYASSSLRLVKRMYVLLAISDDMTVSDVAHMLALGEYPVRGYLSTGFSGEALSVWSRR